jgi:hypothetical protein
MALIWKPGAGEGGRWVKEGVQVGRYVIREIRPAGRAIQWRWTS